ncbi:hypothetical protein K438DRAFT_1175030 [Mycena galopus ATCC 62051]|nr:hypothetical protein K438DRAFT_1175030 [Mycena galopus ATCC 62051]
MAERWNSCSASQTLPACGSCRATDSSWMTQCWDGSPLPGREWRNCILVLVIHNHQCGTLLALHAFARHCPKLHTLEISLDARVVPPLHLGPQVSQQLVHSALLKLNVAESLISDPFEVARFISATCTNVTELGTTLGFDSNDEVQDEGQHPEYTAHLKRYLLWKQVGALMNVHFSYP